MVLNKSDTTRWTMRLTRASPLSLPRPPTLVSKFRTSRVSSKSLIGFSSWVGINFSTEVSARYRQSHARDVRSLVRSQEQDHSSLLFGRAIAFHQARRDRLVHDLAVPFFFLHARLRGVARDAPRWGLGATGRHTADADAVRRVFHG